MQTLIRPSIEHALKEKRREEVDEDGESGPEDPTAYYRRKMKEVDQNLRNSKKSDGGA